MGFPVPGAVWEGVKGVLTDSWRGMWRDDVPFYAAGIAFHSLFSIFALLFLLSLLLGLYGADPDNLRELAGLSAGFLPEEASEFLNTVLEVVQRPVPRGLLPVALVVTLWTSSNVVQALIHALNRIYHLRGEGRAAWRTRLMALAVVGSSAVLLIPGFVLLVLGGELERAAPWGAHLVNWILAARQPLSVAVVFLGALWIYWLAPSFDQEHRVSWPGALVFTAAWAPATLGFNLYLRELAVYDRIYGPLATVVVVLVWVYLSAFLALFGGEVNTSLHRRRSGRSPAIRDEE